MRKYFICNNSCSSNDLVDELTKLNKEFIKSSDFKVELGSLTKLLISNLIDTISSASNAIVSSDNIDPRTGFELGVLAANIDLRELQSILWVIGDSNYVYNELIGISQYKNLKYRCFNMSDMTWSDYAFIGSLYGHSVIVGYGEPKCEFDKCIFSRIFKPSELMDVFGEQLKERNYKLNPNSYDSFRRIPFNIMISNSIN